MTKTEHLLNQISKLEQKTGIKRTVFAVCPNSTAVIKASFRSAKRNNAPIYFAATLNQVDSDGGYTGLTQKQFVKLLAQEATAVDYDGIYIIAIDHGGPWLKDIQSKEHWSLEKAMSGVKKSFEDAILAGYDLIHVDPTVDIFLSDSKTIDIKVVVERTIELIEHTEQFRRVRSLPAISYEVGTEEVHGGLADEAAFDTFLTSLKVGLEARGLSDVWPCFIVGKVGTDLHTTTFDSSVAHKLTKKVKPLGSYIKGHYTDGVSNPEAYPLAGIGAANVGPEFTISEYEGLAELEQIEKVRDKEGQIAQLSNITSTLERLVGESDRWQKWLQPEEKSCSFEELQTDRRAWIIKTCCRYIWQHPEAFMARQILFDNLTRLGMDPHTTLSCRIEHDMDKYFQAFNLVNLNNSLL